MSLSSWCQSGSCKMFFNCLVSIEYENPATALTHVRCPCTLPWQSLRCSAADWVTPFLLCQHDYILDFLSQRWTWRFCHGVAGSFLCILVVCVPFRRSNMFYYWWLFCNNYCLSACHLPSLILSVATWNHCSTGRNSSVGRASDWRSEGPWFNPGFRQLFFLFLHGKNCRNHSTGTDLLVALQSAI